MWEVISAIVSDNFDRIFFTLITIIIVSAFFLDIRDKSYPPGPMCLPFVGYIPFLNSKAPYLTLTELSQQYGRIFRVNFGRVYTVVVADAKILKQILSEEPFHQRAQLSLTVGSSQGKGLLGSDGPIWETQRKFISSVFHNLGSGVEGGKSVFEQQVQRSITAFLQELKENSGRGNDFGPIIKKSVGQVLLEIILGNRYDETNPEWKVLFNAAEEKSSFSAITSVVNYVPWLGRFSKYAGIINSYISNKNKSLKVYKDALANQAQVFNSNDVRSVAEAYVAEMKKKGNTGAYSEEQIQHVLADLVDGGWDTTINTLKWLYLYMALYPDVQERIIHEIAHVTKGKSLVSLEDFDKLTYTEATIMEIWRHRSIVPMGVPHTVKQKTKIGDYFVPKNAMVIPLLWAIHHDGRIFEKPEIFCPERFLHEDGSLFRSENFLPFQTGKRMCPGENLGRMIVQLFFANTMKNFGIQLPKGYAYNPDEFPECGSTLAPRPYKILLESLH